MQPIHEVLGCKVTLYTDPLEPGDTVMIGAARGPVFVIEHIAHGLAWVRPLANGSEGLVAVERLRKV